MKSTIAGVLLLLCSLFTQGQVFSFGLELNDEVIIGNIVAASDTITYSPSSRDGRFAFTGNVEWRIRDKSSLQLGLSASNFISTTFIFGTAPNSNPLDLIFYNYYYEYFKLGVPVALKYNIWRNVHVFGGINVTTLIGSNKRKVNNRINFQEPHRNSLVLYGNAIADQFKNSFVLGRYGIEIGLFKNRYTFYVVAQRSITNLSKNQNRAFPTPSSFNYLSVGIGLQYRLRGKLE